MQLWRYLEGIADQFNLFFLLMAFVVFLVYRKLKPRERTWLIGMSGLYLCIGPFLVLLLNFAPDRQSISIAAPLFAVSHVFISMFVAYGLTIIAAYMAAQYEPPANGCWWAAFAPWTLRCSRWLTIVKP